MGINNFHDNYCCLPTVKKPDNDLSWKLSLWAYEVQRPSGSRNLVNNIREDQELNSGIIWVFSHLFAWLIMCSEEKSLSSWEKLCCTHTHTHTLYTIHYTHIVHTLYILYTKRYCIKGCVMKCDGITPIKQWERKWKCEMFSVSPYPNDPSERCSREKQVKVCILLCIPYGEWERGSGIQDAWSSSWDNTPCFSIFWDTVVR